LVVIRVWCRLHWRSTVMRVVTRPCGRRALIVTATLRRSAWTTHRSTSFDWRRCYCGRVRRLARIERRPIRGWWWTETTAGSRRRTSIVGRYPRHRRPAVRVIVGHITAATSHVSTPTATAQQTTATCNHSTATRNWCRRRSAVGCCCLNCCVVRICSGRRGRSRFNWLNWLNR
jgi:hypothetical protein